METNRFILRLGLLLLAVAVHVTGQDKRNDEPIRDLNRQLAGTLRGLRGVEVVLETLPSEVEQAGLTSTTIRTDVELKLRLAGITVLSKEERLEQPGFPYLYISVNVVLSQHYPKLAYYALDCELHQYVTLTRDTSISTDASTWDKHLLGGTTTLQNIRDNLKDLVDKFINAYLSVNPKK
jgi:hypothetical protein